MNGFLKYFHQKPTIVVSIALGLAGPTLLWVVYPMRREHTKRPAGQPLSYPLEIRPRTIPVGFEDE